MGEGGRRGRRINTVNYESRQQRNTTRCAALRPFKDDVDLSLARCEVSASTYRAGLRRVRRETSPLRDARSYSRVPRGGMCAPREGFTSDKAAITRPTLRRCSRDVERRTAESIVIATSPTHVFLRRLPATNRILLATSRTLAPPPGGRVLLYVPRHAQEGNTVQVFTRTPFSCRGIPAESPRKSLLARRGD